jgi:tRNA1Val (adenine37-N6)-methyltransferase
MRVGTDGVLLGAWANISNAQRILDVGTGTGLIAIMLAQRSTASIDAVEIDNKAFLQAVDNVNNCPWKNRINVVENSFQKYSESALKYDLIISNPPYFEDSLKAEDANRLIARHNDQLTRLDLLSCSRNLMEKNSILSIIMPFTEGCLLIAEAVKFGLFCIRKTNVKTSDKSPIKRLLIEFSPTPARCVEDFITIGKNEKYIKLTNDFYL